MKKNILWLWIFMLPLLQSCATSYGRQNDSIPVYFKTSASQATITCDGTATELPGKIALKRNANHDCIAKAPGFEELHFRIWSKLTAEGFNYSTKINWQEWSKWTLGLGNLVAWPIDFFSGSMKNLESDHYDLKMVPVEAVSTATKVLDQTSNVTQKIASIPADVVEGTTGIVMNSVVTAPAEALGLASDEKRKEAEKEALEKHVVTDMASTPQAS